MENKKKGVAQLFTVSRVIRGLALLCMVCVFMPTFLVSCSGQQQDLSAFTVIEGVQSTYGQVERAHPGYILVLLIPTMVLVLLSVKALGKKFNFRQKALAIQVGMLLDAILWVSMRNGVQRIAEMNYCTAETTNWYKLNMAAILLILAQAALVYLRHLRFDSSLPQWVREVTGRLSTGGLQDTLNRLTKEAARIADRIDCQMEKLTGTKDPEVGYCMGCGAPIGLGQTTCPRCSQPVPEELLEKARRLKEERETEKAAPEVPVQRYCAACGEPLSAGAHFCEGCGQKVLSDLPDEEVKENVT